MIYFVGAVCFVSLFGLDLCQPGQGTWELLIWWGKKTGCDLYVLSLDAYL